MAKKTYSVTLIKTIYYQGTAIVEAENEQQARELADEQHVDVWDHTDTEIEVSEGDDAVTENE